MFLNVPGSDFHQRPRLWTCLLHFHFRNSNACGYCSQIDKRKQKLGGGQDEFPNCLYPLFQVKARCAAVNLKISFHSRAKKTHFRLKGFTGLLALLKGLRTTRKWPMFVLCFDGI